MMHTRMRSTNHSHDKIPRPFYRNQQKAFSKCISRPLIPFQLIVELKIKAIEVWDMGYGAWGLGTGGTLPRRVPVACISFFNPDSRTRRWTPAISWANDDADDPIYWSVDIGLAVIQRSTPWPCGLAGLLGPRKSPRCSRMGYRMLVLKWSWWIWVLIGVAGYKQDGAFVESS